MRPVNPRVGLMSKGNQRLLQRLNEVRQAGRHGTRVETGDLRSLLESQRIETEANLTGTDDFHRRKQAWNLFLREIANADERNMPVAAIDRGSFVGGQGQNE